MQPLQVEAVDAVLALAIPFIVLVLAMINAVTRYLAHRQHVKQAEEYGADGIERYLPHSVMNVLLVLATFYYILVDLNAGVILATFALSMFIADFFEYESRLVEARTDRPIELPKAGLGASVFLLLYAGFTVLVTLFGAFWTPVI
jgi:hypothetical protein